MKDEQGKNLGRNRGDRGPDGRFRSGNKAAVGKRGGGRPKDELRHRMRARSPEAEQVLIDALRAVDGDGFPLWRVRVQAAKEILDRAWGKPSQHMELTGEDEAPLAVLLNLGALPGA